MMPPGLYAGQVSLTRAQVSDLASHVPPSSGRALMW